MLKFYKFIANCFITIISFFIPKSKKYIVIGGWRGQRYADNSKAMFEYLSENKEELGIKRVFFFTYDKQIADQLREKGYDVLLGFNIRSIYWHFRCGVHFIDQNTRDILGWFSVRSIRIDLWHGIPLKKVGYKIPGQEQYLPKWYDKYCSAGFWRDRYIVATSDFTRQLMADSILLPLKKCLISSYPRNVNLYKRKKNNNKQFVVFYLPTFREKLDLNPLLTFDYQIIREVLVSNDIKLIIKPHFMDLNDWKKMELIDNVEVLDAKEDVYDYLHLTDMLITDYSSVYFDYLLSGKPILFFPYDYQTYLNNERGFNFDYDSFTPGDKVYTVNDLLNMIVYVKENVLEYALKWEECYNSTNRLMNKYTDSIDYSAIIELISR